MNQNYEGNFIVEHLAETDQTYRASKDAVLSFMKSYFLQMHEVDVEWSSSEDDDSKFDECQAKADAIHREFWKAGTHYFDYWRPSMSWPSPYASRASDRFSIQQDMLGNFLVFVAASDDPINGPESYLLAMEGDSLKVINKFF